MEIPEIKPNSFKYRKEQQEQAYEKREGNYDKKERATKVVRGPVTTKKKGELSKFASRFISDDAGNVGDHIRDDVLIPAIKDTILDIIIKGATMIFGGRASSRNSPLSNISYYNYGDRFGGSPYSSKPKAVTDARSSMRFDYDNLIFANRSDAEMVLDQMWGSIKRYGLVTVMDLYDMADMTAPYTSDRYGWTDISSASVERVYGGYTIKLPKAMPID